jgi:hypothetical protein
MYNNILYVAFHPHILLIFTLKMEAAYSSTLNTTLCHNQEDHNWQIVFETYLYGVYPT